MERDEFTCKMMPFHKLLRKKTNSFHNRLCIKSVFPKLYLLTYHCGFAYYLYYFLNVFKATSFFLLLFYYSCPNFSPFILLCPSHPPLPQSIPTLLSMSMGHSYMLSSPFLPLLSTIALKCTALTDVAQLVGRHPTK